ncbi:hypothetical protein [Rubrivivax rivuli]|uniref:Uncharacterized protein n=1 Tax=Rubrivivax rivuli TaxID=1862385 RepID=A0A437RGY9_9BURK|nr:hypothetical protein [Rubrivivax rivuli]RVU46019.1 hypothetical protein EOE66_09090 [Rubrivivax rivuli]
MNAPLPRAAAVVGAITLLLLLVPAMAMQFSGDFNWGPGDFAAAGGLLFGAGMAYVITSRRVRTAKHRVLVAMGVLLVLCVVWAELAVGLFD